MVHKRLVKYYHLEELEASLSFAFSSLALRDRLQVDQLCCILLINAAVNSPIKVCVMLHILCDFAVDQKRPSVMDR